MRRFDVLAARRYINFGALAMNYIKVVQDNALLKDDPDTADSYDGQIVAISVIMVRLCCCCGAACIETPLG